MAVSDYPTVNGLLQTDSTGNSTIVINPGGTWDDLPLTWETWLNYNAGAGDTLYWITEPIVMERADYFNFETSIETTGIVEYTIWTSQTGEFAGEEEELVIVENQENIGGFNGKYALLGIKVTEVAVNGPVQINRFSWKTTSRTLSYYFNNYNSSDLEGTPGSRDVYMIKPVSWIVNAQITAQLTSDGYVVADYVADGYFEGGVSLPVFPNIIQKSKDRVKFGLFLTDGTPTDAVFDAVLQVLPEQYANGPNISAR